MRGLIAAEPLIDKKFDSENSTTRCDSDSRIFKALRLQHIRWPVDRVLAGRSRGKEIARRADAGLFPRSAWSAEATTLNDAGMAEGGWAKRGPTEPIELIEKARVSVFSLRADPQRIRPRRLTGHDEPHQ